jgi:hypothetical protein
VHWPRLGPGLRVSGHQAVGRGSAEPTQGSPSQETIFLLPWNGEAFWPRSRVDSSRGEGGSAATRLVIGSRRGSGPLGQRRAAPNTHADSGGPVPQNRAAVPGTTPWPVPILVRSRLRGHSKAAGSPSPGKGPVRLGSRSGRVVRRFLLLRGPAVGAGGPGRVLRHPARLLETASRGSRWVPRPPSAAWPTGPLRTGKAGAAGVPSKRQDAAAAAQDIPERTRGPVTVVCHRKGWPPGLPLGLGSPAAPWLSASQSG